MATQTDKIHPEFPVKVDRNCSSRLEGDSRKSSIRVTALPWHCL